MEYEGKKHYGRGSVKASEEFPDEKLIADQSKDAAQVQLGEPASLVRLLTRAQVTQRQIHSQNPPLPW